MRETCKNCETTIGALETAHLFNEHVVCSTCYTRLSGQPPKAPVVSHTATFVPPPPPRPAVASMPPPTPPASIPMKPCPTCKNAVAINASRCPYCGLAFGARCPHCGEPTRTYYQWYLIVAIVLLFPIGLLLLLLPKQGLCRQCGVEFSVPTLRM